MPGSQSSGDGAQSSFYSSISGNSAVDILRPGDADDLLEERALGHGIMGVMYTVCKEKVSYSNVFIAFRLLADWLQLWLLVVQPPQFSLPPDKLWWQVISFISLNQFMAARGYQFFLACFYLLVAGLLLSIGLSVWVGYSFQQNRFDHVWPIVVLRWFAKIFYQLLDIMSLSLFLMVLDCQTFSRAAEIIGYNQEFPDVYCWSMPHLIHVFVAIVSLIGFVVLAGAFTVGEMELDFTTRNQIAIMHTGKELWTFGIRVLMTFVNVFIYSAKWASIVQLGLSCWLTYLIWYWQPQLEGWVNHTRTGMYASVAWCSLLYAISSFNIGWDASDPSQDTAHTKQLTGLMWGLTIPMGFLGALASWLRLRHFKTTVLGKFKQPIPDNTLNLHKFTDSRFVEVLARCCRVWTDATTLAPDAVLLGEAVIKVGITQMPKDPFMMILHSSFLMDVQSSYQSGYAQLQAAKKLDNSFLMRFAIFSREQQHAQRSAAGSLGNRAADLVSYVEFQRNYGMVLKVHRDTLTNIQRFWHGLMHKTVKFRTLAESVQAMDASIRQADRVYKQVLQRHATSVKIVRLYAKFLEHVKQDPWAAARWFGEAERLAVLEEEMKHTDALEGVELDDPYLKSALIQSGPHEGGNSHDERAVIILNAQSVIVVTNDAVLPILGYNKSELKGKSLRIILPPTVADFHITYVRNYIQTGRGVVVNNTTDQVAMHKDKRLVPVRLTVRKISGIGEDTQFMGVLEPIRTPPNEASIWLRPDGGIILADATFEDWFGYAAKEVQGMSLSALTVSGAKQLEQGIKKALNIVAAEHKRHLAATMKEKKAAKREPSSSEMTVPLSPCLSNEKLTSYYATSDNKSPSHGGFIDEFGGTEADNVIHVPGVGLAHKYANPLVVDLEIRNAGVGSIRYQVLTIKKMADAIVLAPRPAQPSLAQSMSSMQSAWLALPTLHVPQDLMFVTNAKGQVCHISSSLADMLGRTRQQAMANNVSHTVEQLMVRPFGYLHRALLQGIQPTVSPAFSCRSGLSVLMQGSSVQGQQLVQPFSMNISKKAMGEDKYHVAVLQQKTMQQAVDERRMLLQLDDQANVTQVLSQSPASLFGCDPEKLVGKHIGNFINVLRSPGSTPSMEMDALDKQHALEVFLDMASAAVKSTCSTWRVGFLQPEAYQGSESLANAKVRGMLAAKAKPAMMRIKVNVSDTEESEDGLGTISFEVELWRADLCTSVVEINGNGNVLVPEVPELATLYPPDLVLGTPPESLLDQHISSIIPMLSHRSVVELFQPGAFAAPGAVVPRQTKRSAMKAASGALNLAGPVHTISLKHHSDKAELQVTIQAVRKTGPTSRGLFLVLHPAKLTTGRSDFATWIAAQVREQTPASLSAKPSGGGMMVHPGMRLSMLRARLSAAHPTAGLQPPGVVAPATLLTDELHVDLDGEDVAAVVMGADQLLLPAVEGNKLTPPEGSMRPTPPLEPRHAVRVSSIGHGHADTPFIKTAWEGESDEGEIHDGPESEGGVSSDAEQDSDNDDDDLQLDIADDAAAQADVVDEGDFKRGQRFKRLYAMLSSVIVQRPVQVYRKRAYMLTATAVALQVAGFMTMLLLLSDLSTMVNNLTFIGDAGAYSSEVAIYARTLQMLYGGQTADQLRHMTGPSDIPYMKARLKRAIDNFIDTHSRIYLHQGIMPDAYGLHALWDMPSMNITETTSIPYNEYVDNFTIAYQVKTVVGYGLWKAGSILAGRAEAFLNDIDRWNASLNGSSALLGNHTDLEWILDNCPNSVFPGYLLSLDGYLQLVVQKSKDINTAQLVLLLVEGLLLCAVLSYWIYLNLKDVAKLRFNIYNIFMMVPSTLVRRLATRKYVLGDEDGTEEEQQEDARTAIGATQGSGNAQKPTPAFATSQKQAAEATKVAFDVKGALPQETTEVEAERQGSFWGRTMSRMKSALGFTRTQSDKPESKRTLQPCIRTTLWLLWPFLLWGAMVILGNSIGYVLLSQIPGPVAMFNAVNYVKMLYNCNNFYIQELMCNQDVVLQQDLQVQAYNRIIAMRKEYNLMLYGRSFTPGETSPHYTLVTQGVVHANPLGDYLLFETKDCLCDDPADCPVPSDTYYTDSHHGIDRLIVRYMSIGRSLPDYNGLDPYLTGPAYNFYWNTQPSIKGGFSQLNNVFQNFVNANLQSVQILHIVIFVLTLVLFASFLLLMLRPFLKSVHNETQRIAELLSQLPPEVDVTSLVVKTLLPPEPDAGMGLDMVPAAAIANDGAASGKLIGGTEDDSQRGRQSRIGSMAV